MKRRNFLKLAGVGSALASLPTSFNLFANTNADFNGKFLVSLQLQGAWDVSSFCDPKMNMPGEEEINHWSRYSETQTAGNLRYAPISGLSDFFNQYYNDILVINGIDAQTNSHTAGETHNHSGRIAVGLPTLTSLYASINGANLPISYINNGGYGETAGLIRYTRLTDTYKLQSVLEPNVPEFGHQDRLIPGSDWQLIQEARNERFARLKASSTLSPRERLALVDYESALLNSGPISNFANALGTIGDLPEGVQINQDTYSDIQLQMKLALTAMQSGVSVAADLILGGFDTHSNHDAMQWPLLTHVAESIDYFWRTAEELGIAERMVLIVNSDFSRTPHYNSVDGKDHWPVGSAMVMERNVSWGNRVVGVTDEGQNVIPINPDTLQQDDKDGRVIYPRDVMYSLRRYLGINDSPLVTPFDLRQESEFNFFDSNAQTPQGSDVRNSMRV
ncbi:ribulose-phosphate 3-epimerase [Glaciecola sp. KUL10]|nr:ribulose-phosphate 3-epimerase [Glaciecola sp. KUL10]